MKKKIAVIPGDGVGPEVIDQALNVLEAIAITYDHQFDYEYGLIGADALDQTGTPIPVETIDACLGADAVLLGAIGDPKHDNNPDPLYRPEQGLLGLRRALKLYANIRPVYTFPSLSQLSPLKADHIKGVNFTIFRELTGGIYFGEKGMNEGENKAFDTCSYSQDEIERIAHLAFEEALKRRKKLTLVDKSNVLETSRLWRKTVTAIAKKYPEVTYEAIFIDNAAFQMVKFPQQFDIILTSNMFGDILSDEASVLVGSLGLLPSASVGEKVSLFEPIHGSFPQMAGQDTANPIGTILSAALMLESFGLKKEANAVRYVIQVLLEEGIGTDEINPEFPKSCSAFGELVASLLEIKDIVHIDKDRLSEQLSTII